MPIVEAVRLCMALMDPLMQAAAAACPCITPPTHHPNGLHAPAVGHGTMADRRPHCSGAGGVPTHAWRLRRRQSCMAHGCVR